MLSLRVVLVALAVVCAAQAYAGVDSDASPIETYDVRNIFDKILAILEKVRERVKDLDRKLREAVDKGYAKLQAVADKIAESWIQAIQKAVEQAKYLGIDVSECVGDIHLLKESWDKMVKGSRQCIANEEPVVEDMQKKINGLLKQQEHLVQATKEAVEKCKGKPLIEAIRCYVLNGVPLAGEAAHVLTSTRAIAREVAVVTVKSAHNARVCARGVFRTESQAAKGVVDEVTKCIRKKCGDAFKPSALY